MFKLEPIQLGLFYSARLDKYVNANINNYNIVIFHLIRSAQYLPKNYKGQKILEMTDLFSNNYHQTRNKLSFFNPLAYIYLIEEQLVKRFEKKIVQFFNKVILVNKNDIKKNFFKLNKKFKEVPLSAKVKKNIYKFNQFNDKIIFIGNINYLPNKLACIEFSKKVLPLINSIYPNIKFHIIGNISVVNKFFLQNFNNVIVHGKIKKLESVLDHVICGISNMSIATGTQGKILTYLSYGIPSIISKISCTSKLFNPNKNVLVYKDLNDFANKIIKLKNSKIISNKLSKNGFRLIDNKFNSNKLFKNYLNL